MARGLLNKDNYRLESKVLNLLRIGLDDYFLMDLRVTKETYDKMILLSYGNLQNPINARGNTIYRLPLSETDLENYKNSSCSKDSPCAIPNENLVPCDKPTINWIMGVEGLEVNKLKENKNRNTICSTGDKLSYEKLRASLLRSQISLPTVGMGRSRITQEIFQVKSKPYTEVQFVCTPSLSDPLNPKFKDRRESALNLPLAGDNTRLDLSILPKRKNTHVAPFCNEIDLFEENYDGSILLNWFTEEMKLHDSDYRETTTTIIPVLKKLLNGLRYYFDFLKSTGQERLT